MSAAGMSGGGGRAAQRPLLRNRARLLRPLPSQAASEAPAAAAVAAMGSGNCISVLDDFCAATAASTSCSTTTPAAPSAWPSPPEPRRSRLLARCGRSPDDLSSIVLVEPHRHFIRSEAILRIGAALRVPLPQLAAFGFPLPLPLRDAFYDAIANN
ncbi:hypothetical protein PLESTM_000868100, partial [Pleodorina starrii]